MKRILAAALLAAALPAAAQNHFIGVKGGYSRTSVGVSSDYGRDLRQANGFSAGLTYDYQAGKRFQLGAELLYQRRGYETDLVFASDQNPTGVAIPASFSYNYLAVPIKAGLRHGKKIYGFANLAVVPALRINSTLTLGAYDLGGGIQSSGSKKPFDGSRTFDLGGMAELGGGCNLNARSALYASASYQRSFTAFNTATQYPSMTHRGLNASLGFSYALRK